MASRAQLAVVQVVVFMGGGILAPVVHLSRHRADHTHGPDGSTIAFEVDRSLHAAHHLGDSVGEPGEHGHSHPVPHRRPRSAAGHGHPVTEAVPLEPRHGHGSLAHLGLALLSTAPLVALPTPEPAGMLPRAARPSPAALFHPCFPLSRPPPATGLS